MDLAAIKHYRGVAQLVLRWYLEPISGILRLPGSCRSLFDVRVLQFQHDVDRVIDTALAPNEQAFLLLVYSDGMSPADAKTVTSVRMKRPASALVALLRAAYPDDAMTSACLTQLAIETKLGRALTKAGLDRVSDYFSRG